jgi:signal recognition particle receptor subunit beta
MTMHQPTYLKFAVIGLSGAGATTFIQTVSESGPSTGRLDVHIKLGLLPRAPVQWSNVLADKCGVLVLVDSTRPETYSDVLIVIEALRATADVPLIVIANKQDQPDALPPDDIRHKLQLAHNIPVFPGSGKDRTSTRQIIRQLVDWTLEQ